jgi:CheY-like chemotaxis protein
MIRPVRCSRIRARMASTATDTPALPPFRVLVAEDNDIVRETIASFLVKSGMSVKTAADGNEALQCWQTDPAAFDLLLTDHRMPVMTGLELVREIRRNPPAGPALKVIVYSACLGADDAGCYRALQVDRLVEKPCLPQDLVAAVLAVQNRDGD